MHLPSPSTWPSPPPQHQEVKMKERMSRMKAKSKDFIRGFMGMFGRDGRLVGKLQVII